MSYRVQNEYGDLYDDYTNHRWVWDEPPTPESDAPEEECIYPPLVYTWIDDQNVQIPYELYENCIRTKCVGDRLVHSFAAPGSGFLELLITRMDESGVYGIQLRNTLRVLTPEEVK